MDFWPEYNEFKSLGTFQRLEDKRREQTALISGVLHRYLPMM